MVLVIWHNRRNRQLPPYPWPPSFLVKSENDGPHVTLCSGFWLKDAEGNLCTCCTALCEGIRLHSAWLRGGAFADSHGLFNIGMLARWQPKRKWVLVSSHTCQRLQFHVPSKHVKGRYLQAIVHYLSCQHLATGAPGPRRMESARWPDAQQPACPCLTYRDIEQSTPAVKGGT